MVTVFFLFFFSFDYFHIQCFIFTTIVTTKYYLFHDLYFHIYLYFIPYDLWHDGVAYCLHEFKSQKVKKFLGLIPALVGVTGEKLVDEFFCTLPLPAPSPRFWIRLNWIHVQKLTLNWYEQFNSLISKSAKYVFLKNVGGESTLKN